MGERLFRVELIWVEDWGQIASDLWENFQLHFTLYCRRIQRFFTFGTLIIIFGIINRKCERYYKRQLVFRRTSCLLVSNLRGQTQGNEIMI